MSSQVRQSFIEILKKNNYRSDGNDEAMKWLLDYVVAYCNNNAFRGITISGTVGIGKTFFFELFQEFTGTEAINSLFTFREAMKNDNIIYHFGTFNANLIIDDLGAEVRMSRFGVETEIFTEIIGMRYELWRQDGILTFVTTNLSASEIEERYGIRTADRLFEMTSLLTLKGNNKRKFTREEF